MANATWLEAGLNGGWGRQCQPGISTSASDMAAEVREALNRR